MEDGYLPAKVRNKDLEQAGGQGDLRHHDDGPPPLVQNLLDEVEVHLGLAAAGGADNAQRSALGQAEGNILHGGHIAVRIGIAQLFGADFALNVPTLGVPLKFRNFRLTEQAVQSLVGRHASLQAVQTPYCLVLPVDAPKLPVDILEALFS